LGIRPSYYENFNWSTPISSKISKILEWLEMPKHLRPRFISVYIPSADTEGHKSGPYSLELNNTLVSVDNGIADLLNRLNENEIYDEVNLVIVSDHGMTLTDPKNVGFLSDYIDINHVSLVGTPLINLYPNQTNGCLC
jgi:predicted AlkP superfamily pyrophosphatase or phosphodiesterase